VIEHHQGEGRRYESRSRAKFHSTLPTEEISPGSGSGRDGLAYPSLGFITFEGGVRATRPELVARIRAALEAAGIVFRSLASDSDTDALG
jgi:hypothetical protein